MEANGNSVHEFLEHLRTAGEELTLRRDGTPLQWGDESQHRSFYNRDPELYALSAVAGEVKPSQRARVLYQLLERSWVDQSPEVRNVLERSAAFLLSVLHPDQALTVFLALRRARANHKHTSRIMVGYLLRHPEAEDLFLRRRPAVVDCLEHAVGKNVMRACARMLATEQLDLPYLRKRLLRYAGADAATLVPFLYRPPLGAGLVPARGEVRYTLVHQQYLQQLEEGREQPGTVTATNRGDIAATLVHLYRGGPSTELQDALDRYLEDAAAKLPRFEGKVALVLDASASTRSYGEREFCALSQSVALQLILERNCEQLKVFTVGGKGRPPAPEGATDLAGPLLDSLEDDPDLVAVVSDGYENSYPGDLARVAATLPRMGVQTPVIFCHSKFTAGDDLSLRRPAPHLPELEFWRQDNFEELLLLLFTYARGYKGEASLKEFLSRKLDYVERKLKPWTLMS